MIECGVRGSGGDGEEGRARVGFGDRISRAC